MLSMRRGLCFSIFHFTFGACSHSSYLGNSLGNFDKKKKSYYKNQHLNSDFPLTRDLYYLLKMFPCWRYKCNVPKCGFFLSLSLFLSPSLPLSLFLSFFLFLSSSFLAPSSRVVVRKPEFQLLPAEWLCKDHLICKMGQ